MKYLLILSTVFFVQHADASPWRPILSCEGGAMVVDELVSAPYGVSVGQYQLVIRDANVVRHFQSRGLSSAVVNQKNELIVRVHLQNRTFMSAFDSNANALTVAEPDASGTVQVEAVHFQYYGRVLTKLADWKFRNCSVGRR